ncbi:MAG: hypothetical protein ACRDPF_00680, partial [Streptosporangiaceae bacterium]
ISLDLVVALILTRLARARLNRRLWRGLHWFAYLAWGGAVLHSLTSSTDLHRGVLLYLVIGCMAAVAGAGSWRISQAGRELPREERAAATLDMMAPRSVRAPARRGRRENIH